MKAQTLKNHFLSLASGNLANKIKLKLMLLRIRMGKKLLLLILQKVARLQQYRIVMMLTDQQPLTTKIKFSFISNTAIMITGINFRQIVD